MADTKQGRVQISGRIRVTRYKVLGEQVVSQGIRNYKGTTGAVGLVMYHKVVYVPEY